MTPLRIVVLGAGVGGLAAGLSLGRAGHDVILVERDTLELGEPEAAVDWDRRGIPHFMQAHAFTSRATLELLQSLPDVHQALLESGADDIDLARKLPGGERQPGDEHLRMLGIRRPLIEWALRRAVLAETRIAVRSGATATGLVGRPSDVPRVTGVRTAEGSIEADLVIDAMGRRSASDAWIADLGGTPMAAESSDCGVIYYTRYYRVRPGRALPDGPWVPTPRGDLGYGQFSTFPGDNGTFAGLLAIPPGDQELKVLRQPKAFDAATALIPALWSWVNPDTAEPITDVLPMGSLKNTLRSPRNERVPALGLISVGDALCHTDPVFALGLSFCLIEGRELRTALEAHGDDLEAVALAFDAAIRPDIEERYRFATAVDDLRFRRWNGEAFDIAHADGGAYPLFITAAGAAAALVDPDVFRAIIRRNYFLDRLALVDEDRDLQARIERIFAELLASPRPRSGPSRDELLDAIASSAS